MPLHETYGKPIYIQEAYCDGYDGCAIRPVDQDWGSGRSFDPEEQRRWHTALLRAFVKTNASSQRPWIAGVTMFCYRLSLWLAGASFETRVLNANLNEEIREHEHLRRLARVFFRDVPRSTSELEEELPAL